MVPSRGWENTGKGYVNSRVVGIPRSLPKRDRTPGSPSSPLPKTSVNEGCLPLDVDATFQEVGPGSLIHRILLPKDLLGGKRQGIKKQGEIPWQNTWQNVSRKKGSDQSGTCLSYGLRRNVLTVLSIFIHQTSNSYAPRNNKCEGWSYKPDGTLLHRLCFHRQLQHSYQKSSPDAQFRALSKYLENLLWTFKRKTKIRNHSPSVFLFFWNCFQLMSPKFMTLSARCHHTF